MKTPKFIIENVSNASDERVMRMVLNMIHNNYIGQHLHNNRSLNEYSFGGDVFNVSAEKKKYGYKIVVVGMPKEENEEE